ncbi:DUF1129 domain-containing protein [Clostridium tyrobutyricum]|uniref:DUF1129 family protein n=1 Tax=Clostridium tyrobutyricum TaxID=1519 RepID=UPI001C38B571|nr:DUF1129 family protein [Clostridium tyrobutyricum]MBV4419253.1 DUF1129 domain-containing protein [Clostridium tyrobutyricum]
MNKHDNSVEKIINLNNQLREKLTNENKEYYEQLLLYIRSAGLFYDDYEIENLLLQILQDIVSAQNDSQSAEDFFGKSPQVAADELIHNLGKCSRKQTLKLVMLIFGISFFFTILNTLTDPDKGINILILILNGLLSFLIVGIVFFIIHKSVYTKIIKGKIASFVVLWVFCVLIIGSFVLIQLFTPSILILHLSKSLGILAIVILIIVVTIWAFSHEKQDRKIWLPFLPFIWSSGIIGIISRLSLTEKWMRSGNGKITIVILIVLDMIVFWGLTYFNLREKKE